MDNELELVKLEKFLIKQDRKELIAELRNLSNDARRQRLMKQSVHEQEIMDAKNKEAETDRIVNAKAELKSFNATYREQLTMNKKIARFIHLLIEDSGKI